MAIPRVTTDRAEATSRAEGRSSAGAGAWRTATKSGGPSDEERWEESGRFDMRLRLDVALKRCTTSLLAQAHTADRFIRQISTARDNSQTSAGYSICRADGLEMLSWSTSTETLLDLLGKRSPMSYAGQEIEAPVMRTGGHSRGRVDIATETSNVMITAPAGLW